MVETLAERVRRIVGEGLVENPYNSLINKCKTFQEKELTGFRAAGFEEGSIKQLATDQADKESAEHRAKYKEKETALKALGFKFEDGGVRYLGGELRAVLPTYEDAIKLFLAVAVTERDGLWADFILRNNPSAFDVQRLREFQSALEARQEEK